MKETLQSLVGEAIETLRREGVITNEPPADIQITRPKDRAHGDFACNIALVLAKLTGVPPRELAQSVIDRLPEVELIERVEIAGPGFINFHLQAGANHMVIETILAEGQAFGRSHQGAGEKVLIEFVSANPTGPLHVGHGRGAAYGATLANVLEATGHRVAREYYVNDGGRQMDILTVSVWLRYLVLAGEEITFPANGYQGDYIWDIAAGLHRECGEALRHTAETVFAGLPPDTAAGNNEAHVDALIARARKMLTRTQYQQTFKAALDAILANIRDDLSHFGVEYGTWFSEASLVERDAVRAVIDRLRTLDQLYEQDGALWFRATAFGDDKDRVVVRENGQTTYFAADIAYHNDKLERGWERMINVWGADHHGYVPRVRAALTALGYDAARLDVLLVQFASLYRQGEKLKMSTRAGEFVTLRQLRNDVGTDAARFFYVMRRCEAHLDFDIDLAQSKSSDNPVYYVQYAHARICSVFAQLNEKDCIYEPSKADLTRLTQTHELALIEQLTRYPEVLQTAAFSYEVHQLTNYLRGLANAFHTYYNAHPFIVEEAPLRNARLQAIDATRQVVRNGLDLLGVSAPTSM